MGRLILQDLEKAGLENAGPNNVTAR